MKKYTFPNGGSFGKGDSWEGEADVELTNKDATRLEASARKEPRWRLDEDPEIADIEQKVYKAAYNQQIRTLKEDEDFMEELRCDYDAEEEGLSDTKLVKMYLEDTSFHVFYPENLQNLEAEE